MRNLTIKRNKSFVGCAGKDKVYIRDEQAAELTIDGVPCRKLGELKNGKQVTFQIGDEEQKIFVIADKLSKEYCNASVTIPAGQEDVFYSGKHHFVLGSNPFRFDGVQAPEQTARQKKMGRTGTIVFIVAVIVGGIVGTLIGRAIFKADDPTKADPKTFEKDGFKITLTEGFEEADDDELFASYEAKTAAVGVFSEAFADFEGAEDLTVEEYAALVQKSNDREGLEIKEGDGYIYMEYTDTVDGEETYYMVAIYKGEDAFWCVNLCTPEANKEEYEETFEKWAESVDVGQAD